PRHGLPGGRRGLADRPCRGANLAAGLAGRSLYDDFRACRPFHPFQPVRRHAVVVTLLSRRRRRLPGRRAGRIPRRTRRPDDTSVSLDQRGGRAIALASQSKLALLSCHRRHHCWRGTQMMKTTTLGLALGFAIAAAGAANAQVKFGVQGPITGPNAAFGAQLKNGAQQAVDDINAAGGINGQKLALQFGDDVSDPKQGVSVANKFSADGVKFVVGAFNSGVTMPSSEVYQENG